MLAYIHACITFMEYMSLLKIINTRNAIYSYGELKLKSYWVSYTKMMLNLRVSHKIPV